MQILLAEVYLSLRHEEKGQDGWVCAGEDRCGGGAAAGKAQDTEHFISKVEIFQDLTSDLQIISSLVASYLYPEMCVKLYSLLYYKLNASVRL